ncbi:hypothetical protein [Dyadobacter luticola]|nr:hypothetical protein [Dyadobacter luticola]
MNKTKIIYWVVNIVFALMTGVAAIFGAIFAPEAIKNLTELGFLIKH